MLKRIGGVKHHSPPRNGCICIGMENADKTTICDIYLFKKVPVINDKGTEWFGTKRLKAPEEYIKGNAIDEQTNIFTLGVLVFEFFGYFSDEEMKQRYFNNQFKNGWVSDTTLFCLDKDRNIFACV